MIFWSTAFHMAKSDIFLKESYSLFEESLANCPFTQQRLVRLFACSLFRYLLVQHIVVCWELSSVFMSGLDLPQTNLHFNAELP